jgi:hypothetical protein
MLEQYRFFPKLPVSSCSVVLPVSNLRSWKGVVINQEFKVCRVIIKTYHEVEIELLPFLTSVLREYKWLASGLDLFSSRKWPPLPSERLNWEAMAKCKVSHLGESNPGRPACILDCVPSHLDSDNEPITPSDYTLILLIS